MYELISKRCVINGDKYNQAQIGDVIIFAESDVPTVDVDLAF